MIFLFLTVQFKLYASHSKTGERDFHVDNIEQFITKKENLSQIVHLEEGARSYAKKCWCNRK